MMYACWLFFAGLLAGGLLVNLCISRQPDSHHFLKVHLRAKPVFC
jgi:hypothetical protein